MNDQQYRLYLTSKPKTWGLFGIFLILVMAIGLYPGLEQSTKYLVMVVLLPAFYFSIQKFATTKSLWTITNEGIMISFGNGSSSLMAWDDIHSFTEESARIYYELHFRLETGKKSFYRPRGHMNDDFEKLVNEIRLELVKKNQA